MEQVVLGTVPRRPARRRMRGRGLEPTAFKMSPLPGLNSHRSSVKVPCFIVVETPASCHQSAPTHRFLAPVGATSSVPWAQAHGDQAAVALAASSWLTKENKSYRAATGGAFDGMDPGRLDGTSCVGELCPRRPARRRLRGRGLAPTAFKMSPLPGLKSQDGLEAFLCRCLRANCRVSSGVSRRFEMANTMPP